MYLIRLKVIAIYYEQLSICFWSVKILLLHDTVVRLLTVLFVSRQHNKRTKGCSTVIMLESCHLRLLYAQLTINLHKHFAPKVNTLLYMYLSLQYHRCMEGGGGGGVRGAVDAWGHCRTGVM